MQVGAKMDYANLMSLSLQRARTAREVSWRPSASPPRPEPPTRTSTRTRSLARSLARSLTLSPLHAPGQAIALIDQLTTEHGYASTGESLTIADPDEIWCGG